MNQFIKPGDLVVELGAGAGISKEFINNKVILTEIAPYSWIDLQLDAMNLPFCSEGINVVICVNAIHHFAAPIKLLYDLHRCLKPSGYVLIFEPNPSLLFLVLLRMMRHEGWSFDVDVFDPTERVNDPADPWSGNNAISYLMFRDKSVFQENVPAYEIVLDDFAECMMFPLSGGVTAKIKTVELPTAVLKVIDRIDRKLCRFLPMIFAMGRAVALRKRDL